MIQQINLYQENLKPVAAKWHTGLFSYLLIAVFVLLSAYSLYLLFEIDNSQNAIKSTQVQLQQSITELENLHAKHPIQQFNQLLANEVVNAEQKKQSLGKLNKFLLDTSADRNRGFSPYFTALARQNSNDVWLKRVTIDSDKQIIKLHGSTYQAEKTSLFLQALHSEAVFKGKSFATLVMSQDKQTPGQIDFIINTQDESLESDHHAKHTERKI